MSRIPSKTRAEAMEQPGVFERIVAHAEWARKRGKAPSLLLPWTGFSRNPRRALAYARRCAYFPKTGLYLDGMAPASYVCEQCGAHGVKLWRMPHATLDHRCAACLDASPDADGRSPIKPILGVDFGGQKSDCIGDWLPAVPTEDGFIWGYSSVPSAAVAWWRALPSGGVPT